MVLFLIGLLVILLPIWIVLIVLKLSGARRVCSWKLLLLPIWILIGVFVAYVLVTVGFFALISFMHLVLG